MKKENRDIVRVTGFALLVMLAVPGAYRLWTHYHPVAVRPSFSRMLAEAGNRRTEELLLKSCDRWSEDERKAQPQIYAWLAAQGSRLLPWDWSATARQKDPDGYRKSWLALIDGRTAELKAVCAEAGDGERELGRVAADRRVLLEHWTNQLAAVSAFVETNAFPMDVRLVDKAKGRFWGWNETSETHRLSTSTEAEKLLAGLKARADELASGVREVQDGVAAMRESAERLTALVGELAASRARIAADGTEALDELIAKLGVVRTIVKSLGVK